MKQSIIIILVIMFSIIWWWIGAFSFSLLQLGNTLENFDTPAPISKTPVSQNQEIPQKIDLISLENTINETVIEIAPSVVSIVIKKDMVIYRSDPWGFFQQPAGTINRKVWWGSGFFVKKDGTIITNKHVVQDSEAEYTVILNTWEEYDADIVALDPINDLAVIKISDEQREFIPLNIVEDENKIQVWDFWIAVWNALAEFQNSVSLGIVSAKDRSIEAEWDTLSGLIQTDAAINPWNSGGPLINLEWNVIGINTAIASGSNGIGFAFTLTQDRIDYMLKSISESGRIMRPFIGINYIPNSPAVASELGLSIDYWVYIIDEAESIIPESSAQKAWLEPGDIILEVNEEKIGINLLLWNIIQNSLPGDILTLKVLKKSWSEKILELELWAY